MGMLASVASLTLCLAMTATSAFVLLVPKVTPLPYPALRKQTLGVDGEKMGAGGALSRGGGNDGAEGKNIFLPWVPFVGDYIELRSRNIRPMHVFRGVEVRAVYCLLCTASKPCSSACKETACVPYTNLSGNIRNVFVLLLRPKRSLHLQTYPKPYTMGILL